MTIRSKDEIVENINEDLADNNAGNISAADVRENMKDIVESINIIVSSGNFYSTPFVQNVKLSHNTTTGQGGVLYCSGIQFFTGDPGGGAVGSIQDQPYPGAFGVHHSGLAGLGGDHHDAYLPRTGGRTMTGNLGTSNNWINSSGSTGLTTSNGRGIQFSYVNNTSERINVGSGTSLFFLNDKSVMNSARGVAKAWINFDASGITPVVNDAYNVSGLIKETTGQFVIVFNSGVFADNDYVAIAHSNATTSKNEFQMNHVGLVKRTLRSDGTRSIAFYVMDDGGQFCDAKINDLVAYGTEPNGSGDPPVTVVVL
jgi:hypothetical protein